MINKTISMKAKFIPLILNKDKILTTRLKKEGETKRLSYFKLKQKSKKKKTFTHEDLIPVSSIDKVLRENGEVKFAVGDIRQVVVDEEPVWYCPKCKEFETENNLEKNLMAGWHMLHCKGVVPKPLRIKVLSIKEEKLMDITNKDAEREAGTGFKFPKIVFFNDFFSCYLTQALKAVNLCEDKSPFTITKNSEKICEEWNPVVWRIEFLVVK